MPNFPYNVARELLRPGDLVAFSGTAPISYLIDLFSGSNLSHVGMIRVAATPDTDALMTESTIESGKSGPQTHPLGARLAAYGSRARAWWLPLAPNVRSRADWTQFEPFIQGEEGRVKYDTPGLFEFIARSIPIVGPRIFQSEDAGRMFCSGYVTAILEAVGVLRGVNWSKTSPQDLAEMKLYRECVQIAGTPARIRNFNTV